MIVRIVRMWKQKGSLMEIPTTFSHRIDYSSPTNCAAALSVLSLNCKD